MTVSIATSGIVGQAFRLMEMQPISSFGDGSEQALAAAEQYPAALDSCLEEGDWSFASQPVQLPAVVGEASGDPELAHVYMRPSDLLVIRSVHPKCTVWRLDRDRLRADQPAPLFVRYTARISDEGRLPGLFRLAVSYRLASLLAPRWTKSANRSENLRKGSDEYIEKARIADRGQASSRRYDGDDEAGDWAHEARR